MKAMGEQNVGPRRGGLGGHCGFLTRDLVDRVILDVIDNLVYLKVSC